MLIVQFTEVNPHILNTGRCKLAQSDFNKAVTGNVTSGFVSLVVMVTVAAVVIVCVCNETKDYRNGWGKGEYLNPYKCTHGNISWEPSLTTALQRNKVLWSPLWEAMN